MTTATEQATAPLPWDYFLPEEGGSVRRVRDRYRSEQPTMRHHIDMYRINDWPQIKRGLAAEHGWDVPDELEPHWTAPGRAVLWQEQFVDEVTSVDGKRQRIRVSTGWEPTQPQRVNSPSILVSFLERGLHLRPPTNGGPTVTKAVETARLSEGSDPSAEGQPVQFLCNNHGFDIFAYATWKAYIGHCKARAEVPDLTQMPVEVQERAKTFAFYCALHDHGFQSDKLALRHIKAEARRPRSRGHPGLEDMRMPSQTRQIEEEAAEGAVPVVPQPQQEERRRRGRPRKEN